MAASTMPSSPPPKVPSSGDGLTSGPFRRPALQAVARYGWETELGERLSRVELTTEDVGASLAYATAEMSWGQRPADVAGKEGIES